MSDQMPTFRLTVVPLASDPRPVATRLRLAIKYLLRAQALRLVSIEELAPAPAPERCSGDVRAEEGDKGGA